MSRREPTTFDEDVLQNEHNTCPECSGRVTTNAKETVCDDCGLVLEDQRLDRGPERRPFSEKESNRERTGAPLTQGRHDRGLSSEIGWDRTDARGNTLTGRKRHQLSRLRREHSRARHESTADRTLAQACSEIARIVSALGLERSIREQASRLFRSAQSADLLPGRSMEAMAAASVYATCRCNGLGRALEEVGAVAQVTTENVKHNYRVLNRELGLPTSVQRPIDLLPRVTSACGVSDAITRRAREILTRFEERDLVNGRQPSGIVAAAVWVAATEEGVSLTQSSVARAANTSTTTLRIRCEELTDC